MVVTDEDEIDGRRPIHPMDDPMKSRELAELDVGVDADCGVDGRRSLPAARYTRKAWLSPPAVESACARQW